MQVIDTLLRVLWGSGDNPLILQAGILGVLLIAVGLYLTVRLGAIQVRHFGHMLGAFARSIRPEHAGGISGFQAFSTSLAARVGAGNISGVAIAITVGGPGAILWMWVVALVGMATAMVEATLAQTFKHRDTEEGQNVFRGGPAYYMQRGLGRRWMGVVFSVFLILAFPFAFNSLQSNTVATAVENSFGIDPGVVGFFIAALTAGIIFGGIKRIAKFAEVAVPFMALAYLGLGLVVIAINIAEVPAVLADIVLNAFGLREAAGGAIGFTVAQALSQGLRRGLFSNEAGLGSAPNAAATADVPHPTNQGYIQALGVFVDTIVICTTTALIILLSGVWSPGVTGYDGRGVALTQDALSASVGDWGGDFVALALVFFAFTSIVANYYYGETSVLFLRGDHRILVPMRILVVAGVFGGAIASVSTVWDIADVALGLMALVNLTAVVLLSRVGIAVIRNYEDQMKQGLTPSFTHDSVPGIGSRLEPDVWVPDRSDRLAGRAPDPLT
jgi:alanine or glycine:cation symporter, AGCS family